MGLSHLGKDKEDGKIMDYVSKEKILGDIQFRGAISDFYVAKTQVLEADYDPLLIRINEDDIYGDGNNFEVGGRHGSLRFRLACIGLACTGNVRRLGSSVFMRMMYARTATTSRGMLVGGWQSEIAWALHGVENCLVWVDLNSE